MILGLQCDDQMMCLVISFNPFGSQYLVVTSCVVTLLMATKDTGVSDLKSRENFSIHS